MGYGWRGVWVVSAVTLASLALFGAGSAVSRGDGDDDGRRGGERVSRLPAQINAAWQQECGSCHVAYPPGLLPRASWERIMAGLDKHFGENAALPAATVAEIAAFLAAHAADAGGPAETTAPLRITETAWFRREHREVGAPVWKRPAVGGPANCAACHRGAEQGHFDEHAVKIPR